MSEVATKEPWTASRREWSQLMFQIGDRVRVKSMASAKRFGTIVGEKRRFGQFRWVVQLDEPLAKRTVISVPAAALIAIDGSQRLHPGDRAVVIAGVLEGHKGTLVRPARLLWKRAWLVDLDSVGVGRTRVTERLLRRM